MANRLLGCPSQGFNSSSVVHCYGKVFVCVVLVVCADFKRLLLKYGSSSTQQNTTWPACNKTPAKSTACVNSTGLLKICCGRTATVSCACTRTGRQLLQP